MEKKTHYDTLETMHGTFQTTYNKMYRERKPWVPANPKNIVCHIPGTIVKVMVKEGDQVKPGDLLILFKAMKMNNNVVAQKAGTIKKICVKAGENVKNHTVLIEME